MRNGINQKTPKAVRFLKELNNSTKGLQISQKDKSQQSIYLHSQPASCPTKDHNSVINFG